MPCLLALFSAGQAVRLTMTGTTCHTLFLLPLLFPSSAAKASPAVTAVSSSGTGNDSERICTLRPDVSLENPMLPVALKEIALVELDRINLKKQMILKFAAIIGPVFTTQQLAHIVPIGETHQINSLREMLVEDNILKRLENIEKPEDKRGATKRLPTSGQAGSGLKSPSVSREAMQRQCEILAFCTPLLWEAAYELWPMKQKVNIHHECAAFLERHAYKCRRCHGGDSVACHRFGISSPQEQGNCQALLTRTTGAAGRPW